jgi:hypothetical protein
MTNSIPAVYLDTYYGNLSIFTYRVDDCSDRSTIDRAAQVYIRTSLSLIFFSA